MDKNRKNVYFRQDAKSFKADNQTKVYAAINRNLPYRLYVYSKNKVKSNVSFLNSLFNKNRKKTENY